MWCRTGDDVESDQEVFHRLARFVLTFRLGQHSNLSGGKRAIDIDGFLMFVIESHYKSKPDSECSTISSKCSRIKIIIRRKEGRAI